MRLKVNSIEFISKLIETIVSFAMLDYCVWCAFGSHWNFEKFLSVQAQSVEDYPQLRQTPLRETPLWDIILGESHSQNESNPFDISLFSRVPLQFWVRGDFDVLQTSLRAAMIHGDR